MRSRTVRGRAFVLLLIAAVAAGCGEPTEDDARRDHHARVTKVTDGDTIRLGELGPVRLIGIDTPEVYGGEECFGREASAFAKRLLPIGTRVRYRLGVDERDPYGRLLAYVWLPDGRMLNRVLVDEGYAQPLTIPPNVDFAEAFRRAARAARQAGIGLWRACRAGG
jgi:micrococcal nuclease